MAEYRPRPQDTSGIELGPHLGELTELLARHTHDVWARLRYAQGWQYGPVRDDAAKRHPCLIPYEQLPESEKDADRATAIGTLKAIVALGYELRAGAGPTPRLASGGDIGLLAQLREGAELSLAELQTQWGEHREEDWAPHADLYYAVGRRFVKLGSPFLAHEVAAEGLRFWPRDVPLRQLAANALARAGSSLRANVIMQSLYQEGYRDEDTLGILGRTHKDLAIQATGAERARHLERALQAYREGFIATGGSYTGINAATLALLAGHQDESRALATKTRVAATIEMDQRPGAPYYLLATLGEAALVLGDDVEARRWYGEAIEAGRGLWGELTSTRRNARLILEHQHRLDLLDSLVPMPQVVVFSGHMVDRPGRANPRFPSTAEAAVARVIAARLDGMRAGFGFAGAAAGGDLLFHEVMRARGGEISVVLPYPEHEFIEDSVAAVAGPSWGERFANVMAAASDVVVATGGRFVQGGVLHQYANDLMLGMGVIRAAELDTTVHALVLWNGEPGDGVGGTATAVADWRERGFPVEVIDLKEITHVNSGGAVGQASAAPAPPANDELDTRIMGVLFADVVNFSKLSDVEIPRFVEHFLGGVAALRASPDAPMISNTWGDGLYFVFEGVGSAGRWALDLSNFVTGTDWGAKGLPADLNLRVALHAGPLFRCMDPVTGQINFTGKQVVPAARLEPVTPPGMVYASREFAAVAAAERARGFVCEPVGRIGLAKKAGTIPVYVVSRR